LSVATITRVALPENTANAWAHPGATCTIDGALIVAATGGQHIHRLEGSQVVGTIRVPTTECHGLAATADGGLWIADPGTKGHLHDGVVASTNAAGQVVLVDSSGRIRQRVAPPTTEWMPTGVALHDFGRASDGRLFVADGYGAGLVHCFAADGSLLWTTEGVATGTPFDTPHGVIVDTRTTPARLLVADRGNRRIVVLSLDGELLGSFGSDYLTSPSSFAISGEWVWITELFGAMVAASTDGELLERIGTTDDHAEPGWPNRVIDGLVAPPAEPEWFRSPHGIAASPNGTILVAEWVIGGRVSLIGAP
jgi:outer membrane protein assembly factor BamB